MRLLVTAIIGIGLSLTASAQQPSRFVSSEEARAVIRELVAGPTSELVRRNIPPASRAQFESAVTWLGRATVPDQVPAVLVRAVRTDIEVLRSEKRPERVRIAAVEDLFLKADLCRNSRDGLGASIPVNVRTLAGSAESKGWEIVYKTAVEMEDPSISANQFPTFSSPTGERLPAGRYHLWARDPKAPAKRGPSREVMIDGKQPTVAIDLVAP